MALPSIYDLTDPTSNLAADRLILPPFIEDNRIDYAERWALPLAVGTAVWLAGRGLLPTAAWTLGAYMAPMPVAALQALMMARGAQRATALSGLERVRFKRKRCIKYRYVRGKRFCAKYSR